MLSWQSIPPGRSIPHPWKNAPALVQFPKRGSQGFSSQIIVPKGSGVHPSLNVAPPPSLARAPGVFLGCFPTWCELQPGCLLCGIGAKLSIPPELKPPGQEGISAVAAVLRGLRAPWVSLQLSTRSSWGPCSALSLPSSHRKPDPLSPGAGREAGQCLASPAHPKLPASPSCARDGCSPKTLLCEIAPSKLPEKMHGFSFPVFPGISSSCFTNPTALTTSQILPSLCCSFLLNPFVAPVVH